MGKIGDEIRRAKRIKRVMGKSNSKGKVFDLDMALDGFKRRN